MVWWCVGRWMYLLICFPFSNGWVGRMHVWWAFWFEGFLVDWSCWLFVLMPLVVWSCGWSVEWLFVLLFGSLIGCLSEWLVGWLFDLLSGLLVDLSIGLLIYLTCVWLDVCLHDWLSDWLMGFLFACSFALLFDVLIVWSGDLLVVRCIGCFFFSEGLVGRMNAWRVVWLEECLFYG